MYLNSFDWAAADRALFTFLMSHLKLKLGFSLDATRPDVGLGTGPFVANALEQDLLNGGVKTFYLVFGQAAGEP